MEWRNDLILDGLLSGAEQRALTTYRSHARRESTCDDLRKL
jgi:hypothetical protein